MKNQTHPHLIFVYGTLQNGHVNNDVMTGLKGSDAIFMGHAFTLQKFYMADGGFPRVGRLVLEDFPASKSRNDYRGQVSGELWAGNDGALKACDRLEGHPTFYRRELIPVFTIKDRTRHAAWMYLIVEPFPAHRCIAKNKSGILQWREDADA